MTPWVFQFCTPQAEGNASLGDLLGNKGACLAEMSRLGMDVPPGFTLTTEVCRQYFAAGGLPASVETAFRDALTILEERTLQRFGDADNPLVVAVRSGSPVSMPGMMDTVLNLGLTPASVASLAGRYGENMDFAWSTYGRFVQQFADVVMGVDPYLFEDVKERFTDEIDAPLSLEQWPDAIDAFKQEILAEYGQPFPEDPLEQLIRAIQAVFDSWNSDRAKAYRKIHRIEESLCTAVTVQQMAFGNIDASSGAGVVFTRDPNSGQRGLYGEYLVQAQGEDIVGGILTPHLIDDERGGGLRDVWPRIYDDLAATVETLERAFGDMQEVEFTVEEGALKLLQTRRAKRSAMASVEIAVDLAEAGRITRDQALRVVSVHEIEQLLHPRLDPKAERQVATRGLPSSPGAVSGEIAFTATEAIDRAQAGARVLLVRPETSPDDIRGMAAAVGILTSTGGMTSHAAVVARGMGVPCVSGARAVSIDMSKRTLTIGDQVLQSGDTLTIDGSTGDVMLGRVRTIAPALPESFDKLMGWADNARRIQIYANAETVAEAQTAIRFGASGIGLCRTEHMFFAHDRLPLMREMILARSDTERRRALEALQPLQEGDFEALIEVMEGRVLTIRLLDPPLHEFLPGTDAEIEALAYASKLDADYIRERVVELTEVNPMMGLRGCRLGLLYPEVYDMQMAAILSAMVNCTNRGIAVNVQIMAPLISTVKELAALKGRLDTICAETAPTLHRTPKFGTMIETPRACLIAEEMAAVADFFSFGTNDLTQMTMAISRDDAARFLPAYADSGILPENPFKTLDIKGVGKLMRMAVMEGRRQNPTLPVGICGEQAADPTSVDAVQRWGLTSASCSAYRVPLARLAAAQTALADRERMSALGADEPIMGVYR